MTGVNRKSVGLPLCSSVVKNPSPRFPSCPLWSTLSAALAEPFNSCEDLNVKSLARVRVTDIFTYRDGLWQALAGQETLVSEASR